jgi:hypothetical protein
MGRASQQAGRVTVSTDGVPRRNPGDGYDSRVHLRLSTTLASRLEAAFETQSRGIRAAMQHVVSEAPLAKWPVATDGADLEGESVKRVSVRVPPALDADLEAAVEPAAAPEKSRAVRDAARDLLG